MTNCIEYQGKRTKDGYGYFYRDRRIVLAHREAYQLHHVVTLTQQQHVCHHCDNPSCINIDHLFVGSARDNIHDCISKGRRATHHRYHHRVKTVDTNIIDSIRNATDLSLKDAALKFNVSQSYISKIRNGKAKRLLP